MGQFGSEIVVTECVFKIYYAGIKTDDFALPISKTRLRSTPVLQIELNVPSSIPLRNGAELERLPAVMRRLPSGVQCNAMQCVVVAALPMLTSADL